jgi:hypothetical protein
MGFAVDGNPFDVEGLDHGIEVHEFAQLQCG